VEKLSPEQERAVDAQPGAPLRLVDERNQAAYVLLPAASYEKVRALLEDEVFDVREAYPLMDAVAGPEGWDDAGMDTYDDPRGDAPS
jgi:hypothetical protein